MTVYYRKKKDNTTQQYGIINNVTLNKLNKIASNFDSLKKVIRQIIKFDIIVITNDIKILITKEIAADNIIQSYIRTLSKFFDLDLRRNDDSKLIDMKTVSNHIHTSKNTKKDIFLRKHNIDDFEIMDPSMIKHKKHKSHKRHRKHHTHHHTHKNSPVNTGCSDTDSINSDNEEYPDSPDVNGYLPTTITVGDIISESDTFIYIIKNVIICDDFEQYDNELPMIDIEICIRVEYD